MKFKDIDSEVDGAQDRDDRGLDSRYDHDLSDDLRDDPMISPEKPTGRKGRKEAKERQRHREYMAREREAMKAEILAELRGEEDGADGATQQEQVDIKEERRGGKSSRKNVDKQEPAGEKADKSSRFSEYLMSILSGNILSREEVRRVYPYMLFMAFLAFLYIVNVFNMQQLHRQREELSIEVKELRARSMITTSYRIQATRQSNIMAEVERRGIPLRESLAPNKVIEK